MTVTVPDEADEWPFEAKAAAISEANDAADIRSEVDSIAGIPDPSWEGQSDRASAFTKYELTLILLALGGPQ